MLRSQPFHLLRDLCRSSGRQRLICNELVLHVAAFPGPNELLFEMGLCSFVRSKPAALAGSQVR